MLGKTLSHHLKYGKLKSIGKPLYETIIAGQLKLIKLQNHQKTFLETPLVNSQLTAIIKTFERPNTLKRLLDSLFYYYPNMNVIVVDDSKKALNDTRVKNINLPYDSGVSIGRQTALDNVITSYTLLLDDDFIFYDKTSLEPILEILEQNQKIDIIGGEVINLPSFKANSYKNANLHPTNAKTLMPIGTELGQLTVYDKVANFYIARTERLKLVGWDPQLKRLDHADFFTRAKGILLTTFTKEFKILHAQTPFNIKYMQIRNDVEKDRKKLYIKYYQKN